MILGRPLTLKERVKEKEKENPVGKDPVYPKRHGKVIGERMHQMGANFVTVFICTTLVRLHNANSVILVQSLSMGKFAVRSIVHTIIPKARTDSLKQRTYKILIRRIQDYWQTV